VSPLGGGDVTPCVLSPERVGGAGVRGAVPPGGGTCEDVHCHDAHRCAYTTILPSLLRPPTNFSHDLLSLTQVDQSVPLASPAGGA